jgi:hypothetical protein
MYGVKANSGVWMENTRLGKPPVSQLLHPRPRQVVLLTRWINMVLQSRMTR